MNNIKREENKRSRVSKLKTKDCKKKGTRKIWKELENKTTLSYLRERSLLRDQIR